MPAPCPEFAWTRVGDVAAGRPFVVREVDRWSTGARVCRFGADTV